MQQSGEKPRMGQKIRGKSPQGQRSARSPLGLQLWSCKTANPAFCLQFIISSQYHCDRSPSRISSSRTSLQISGYNPAGGLPKCASNLSCSSGMFSVPRPTPELVVSSLACFHCAFIKNVSYDEAVYNSSQNGISKRHAIFGQSKAHSTQSAQLTNSLHASELQLAAASRISTVQGL